MDATEKICALASLSCQWPEKQQDQGDPLSNRGPVLLRAVPAALIWDWTLRVTFSSCRIFSQTLLPFTL